MTQLDKLKVRFKNARATFPWGDLLTLLLRLGYIPYERAGSRIVFIDAQGDAIHLHKPHPNNYLKGRAINDIKHHLQQRGML